MPRRPRLSSFGSRSFLCCFGGSCSWPRVSRAVAAARRRFPDLVAVRDGRRCVRFVVPSERDCCLFLLRW